MQLIFSSELVCQLGGLRVWAVELSGPEAVEDSAHVRRRWQTLGGWCGIDGRAEYGCRLEGLFGDTTNAPPFLQPSNGPHAASLTAL